MNFCLRVQPKDDKSHEELYMYKYLQIVTNCFKLVISKSRFTTVWLRITGVNVSCLLESMFDIAC